MGHHRCDSSISSHHRKKRCHCKKENSCGGCNSTPINQHMIDKSQGVLLLNKSGGYTLSQDVKGTILIQANNIFLDLCHHTIDANGANNAILVQAPVTTQVSQNVKTIHNQPVQERDVTSPLDGADEDLVPPADQKKPMRWSDAFKMDDEVLIPQIKKRELSYPTTIRNVHVFNGTIINSTIAGISFGGVETFSVKDVAFYNNVLDGIHVESCSGMELQNLSFSKGDSVLSVEGLTQAIIKNIKVVEYVARTDSLFNFLDTHNLQAENLNCSGNSKIAPASQVRYTHTAMILLDSSDNFSFDGLNLSQCNLDYMAIPVSGFLNSGILMNNCYNGSFNNYKFNFCQTIGNPRSFFNVPIFIFWPVKANGDYCYNMKLTNCQVNDNKFLAPESAFSGTVGFAISSKKGLDWTFENCEVNRNLMNLGSGWLIGDVNLDAGNVIIRNCKYNDNLYEEMIGMRGISFEAYGAGSKVMICENFQFNRNTVKAVHFSGAGAFYPDTNCILVFDLNNAVSIKNLECNYNYISEVAQFTGVALQSNVGYIDGLKFNNNTIGKFNENFDYATISATGASGYQDSASNQKFTNIQMTQNIVLTAPSSNYSTTASLFGVYAWSYSGNQNANIDIDTVQFADNHILLGTGSFDVTAIAAVELEVMRNVKISRVFSSRNSGANFNPYTGYGNFGILAAYGCENIIIEDNNILDTGAISTEFGNWITSDDPNLPPIPFKYTNLSQPLTSPITAPAALAVPLNACTPLTNNLTGKIGVFQWSVPSCAGSGTRVGRVAAAGSIATILIDTVGQGYNGINSQVNVVVNASDGNLLLNAIAANPNIQLTLASPSGDDVGAVGIYVSGVNCKVLRNEVLTSTGAGILLDNTCSKCIVQDNHAMGNGGSGFVDQSNKKNTFLGNKASENASPQYSGVAAGNIVTYDNITGVYGSPNVYATSNIDIL